MTEHGLYAIRAPFGGPRSRAWVLLMLRAFDLNVLRCPRCTGRMQLIATIDDPAVIQRLLPISGCLIRGRNHGPRSP